MLGEAGWPGVLGAHGVERLPRRSHMGLVAQRGRDKDPAPASARLGRGCGAGSRTRRDRDSHRIRVLHPSPTPPRTGGKALPRGSGSRDPQHGLKAHGCMQLFPKHPDVQQGSARERQGGSDDGVGVPLRCIVGAAGCGLCPRCRAQLMPARAACACSAPHESLPPCRP